MKNCKTILVVEDDLFIQCTLREALELDGYMVLTASNGSEALQLLINVERPALIFTDIMMPIMDGHQFLKHLRNDVTLASIPVVMISAAAHISSTHEANCFIPKPLDLDVVLQTAKKFCHESLSVR